MSLSFRSVSVELSIHLPPAGLSDISSSVANQLNSYIFQYSPACGGVLLSYKSVRYLTQLGSILYDKPWIHFTIAVEFLVLVVAPGEILTGQVVAINAHALTLLVCGVFNASIAKTRGIPNFMRFSPAANRFVDSRKALQTMKQENSREEKEVLSKKSAKKAAKLAEKEAKRAAYYASIGQNAPLENNQNNELEGSIGLGDSVVFEVLGVDKSHSREYFSIQAKLISLDPRGNNQQIEGEKNKNQIKKEVQEESSNEEEMNNQKRIQAVKHENYAQAEHLKVKEEVSDQEEEKKKKKKSKAKEKEKSKSKSSHKVEKRKREDESDSEDSNEKEKGKKEKKEKKHKKQKSK
jgi:hypothetical protein